MAGGTVVFDKDTARRVLRATLAVERAIPSLLTGRRRPPIDVGGGTGAGIPVQITAGGPGKEYTVDVYANGYYNDDGTTKDTTSSGKTLFVLQVNAAATIPKGARLMANKVATHYEADLGARWL